MNIVVLGAGTVGWSVSDLLCRNGHSVNVVDSDPNQTRAINNELDVRAITGSASQSSVLFQAGVTTADVCLAVTGVDEVNLVAASMAKSMGTRRTIARVFSTVFRDLSTFDYQSHFRIDQLLSLEHLSALEFARNIRDPGSVVVEQFARGELEVNELQVAANSPVTRKPLKDLRLPSKIRVGTIKRGQKMWIAGADDQLEADDRVYVFGRPDDVASHLSLFIPKQSSRKRVVIAGGGETGLHLASTLERENFSVLLMEEDEQRCQFLANQLQHTTVIHCDATRREIMQEERVGTADVFVACTGDDENNIMAGVEARDLGAEQIMAIVGRPDYALVVGKLGIDVAVSERQVMAKQFLSYMNEGVVVSQTRLPGGEINLFELEVMAGAPATQMTLADLQLPKASLIVALIRQEFVRIPQADDTMQHGDKIVLLVDESVKDPAIAQFAGA